jgi:putative peptidoglycan lipid II flippase
MTVRRLAGAATIVAFFAVASRLLGLLRDALMSRTFGASAETDAFINSLLIVNSVAAVLLYALVTVVIPQFQAEREVHGVSSAWRLAWTLTSWVAIGLTAFAALLVVAPQIGAIPFRFDEELAREMEPLIRIMAPAVLLQGLSALATALLQIHGRFAGPAAIGVAFNAGIIGGVLLLSDSIGIEGAAWGVTAGALLQVLLQAPQFISLMKGVDIAMTLTHPRLTATAALAGPVFAASLLQQVNNFSDKMFAATLEEGRISALTWANTVGQAPRAIILLPLLTPLFPLMAGLVAEGRRPEVVAAYRRAAGLIGVLAFPVMAFLVIFAEEISQLLFGGSKCDADCVDQIAAPLVFYGLAVWPGFAGFLNNRLLSAASRTRDVMVSTIVVVTLTIVLDALLIGSLEQSGLALASALALMVNVGVTFTFLRREFPQLSAAAAALQQARLLLVALIAGGAVATVYALSGWDAGDGLPLIGLLAAFGAGGALLYALLLRALAPREFAEAGRTLRSAARRRRRTAP